MFTLRYELNIENISMTLLGRVVNQQAVFRRSLHSLQWPESSDVPLHCEVLSTPTASQFDTIQKVIFSLLG
jgi:hypothetical protein